MKKIMTLETATNEVETSTYNSDEIEKARTKFRDNYSKLSSYIHNPLLEEVEKKLKVEKDNKKVHELLKEKGMCLLNPLLDLFSIAINSSIETKDNEPVIVYSFSVWREEGLKILDELTKDFPYDIRKELTIYLIQKIDYEFLPQFIKKAWTRHALGINVYNFGVQLDSTLLSYEKGNTFYKQLVKAISKWLIHLELICDLVDRLKKYKILDYNEIEIFQKCKSKWKTASEGIPMRHIIKSCTWNMAVRLHDKFSSTFYSLLKTFAIYHFPFTFTVSLGMLKSLLKGTFINGVINYSVICYFGVLIAGLMTALTMQMSRRKLTDKRAMEDLGVLIDSFKVSTSNINDLLRQVNVILIDIIKAGHFGEFQTKKELGTEEQKTSKEEKKAEATEESKKEEVKESEGVEKLKEILEMLAEKKKPVYGYEQIKGEELSDTHYLVEYFKTNLVDTDWVHITKINIEQAKVNEELVGSLLKLSFMPNK